MKVMINSFTGVIEKGLTADSQGNFSSEGGQFAPRFPGYIHHNQTMDNYMIEYTIIAATDSQMDNSYQKTFTKDETCFEP